MPSSADVQRLTAALADRYRIERELGAGGMATVYLAHDLKHDRPVAIKVLKPELAAVLGAERFIHEIKTTAQLQHPHILPLFDSGQADGFLFYVMPYIEGETLRDRLTRETQLGIAEAVKITTEVSDALDYAHRRGVIHRDIKPENILLHDGRPMVADFGIALALSAAAGGRMTETGMSLGTPHYMSPEQATADKEITGRSDIYSLGTVLYEMLTGEPPHMGNSAQQIVMKILTEDAPPVTKLRKSVPPNVADAVATALEKLPADRFETAHAFAQALADPHFHTDHAAATSPRGAAPAGRRLTMALGVGLVLVTAVAVWALTRPRPVPPLARYALYLPDDQAPDFAGYAVITPDGSRIIYAGPSDRPGVLQLWMKPRDQVTASPIPGTGGATAAAVSPDGRWLAFIQGDSVLKLPLAGGPPTLLAGGASNAAGSLAWLEDNSVLFVSDAKTQVKRIPEAGGTGAVVWSSDTLAAFGLSALPGSRGLLMTTCRLPCARTVDLWALDLRTRTAHSVLVGAGEGFYVGHGILIYVRIDHTAMAVPFDLGSLTARGEPVEVEDSISWGNVLTPYFTVSASGTLVAETGPGRGLARYQLVWVNRSGHESGIDTTWTFQLTEFAGDEGMALSSDASRLLIGLHTPSGDGVWLKRLPAGPVSRVSPSGVAYRPRWAPDPAFATYMTQAGAVMHRVDGTGTDSILLKGGFDEAQFSPDRRWLIYRTGAAGPVAGGRDIYGVHPGDTTRVPLIATRYDEMAFTISPDGHWIAYQSDEAGRVEVFVRPFPNTSAGKTQVSVDGGTGALWSRNGRELFYVRSSDSTMMEVPVSAAGGTITLGTPHSLFKLSPALAASSSRFYTPWDVGPDGRFLMTRAVRSAEVVRKPLIVVENWVQDVMRKMNRN